MRDESLTEEQRMIRDMVGDFVGGSVASQAVAIDANATIPDALLEELAELGLLCVPLPEAAGGAGFDFVSLTLVLAAIAGECPALAQHVLFQTIDGVLMLAESGGQETHMEAVAGGSATVAFCELDNGGSWDAAKGQLTGHATCVLGGVGADLILVSVSDESQPMLLLVESEKIQCGESRNRLGMRGVTACDVSFTSSTAVVLAEDDAALKLVAMRKSREWVGALAIASGLAKSVSEIACAYAREREQFGGPIARLGAVQEMMARTDVAYRIASELTQSLASGIDRGEDVRLAARAARIVAGDLVMHAADVGLQIHGGYGFSQEYAIERFYRDARQIAVMGGCEDELLAACAQLLV